MFENQTEEEEEEVIFKRDNKKRIDLHYKEGKKNLPWDWCRRDKVDYASSCQCFEGLCGPLEFNELSGELPMELGKLQNLLAVNISHNSLTGKLLIGSIFQNLDKSSLEGNYGLCSPLLTGPCKMNVPKPLVLDPHGYNDQMDPRIPRNESSESSSPIHHHRFLSISAIIAISASIVIVIGVIAISLVNASVRRKLAFVENALESMCSSSSR
ncbi:LRR receptor-like kinase family protein, putative [Medicago truncatula]|uniref:LRR receptor-like kinase family protein, putative n=1 Tax=Medicago truncatula TaxID=3880 RepID=G7KTX3_MEDTR|nr:LRR receptor-like kinase family protein, putative [Medicago truncatula]